MTTKSQAKNTIEKLVEKFDSHYLEYKKNSYQETPTRVDFINPFFEALGWDITDKLGLGVVMRDVIHEDKLKIDGVTKAPDYCFTINGTRKFFLEAKRPGINIKDQIDPAYQVRRYGWNAKLPISILTDFEEFSVYDCTIQPSQNERAVIARIKYFTYKDYISEFDFLWDTFSKESVIAGSLDKYAIVNKSKKGSEGVDAAFLKSLDSWRDVLARNLVLKNVNINEDELNYAIQKIIDRIIFLRICEDRGIEPELQLFNTIGTNTYNKLKNIFDIADQKYNSGLFDFKKDVITSKLNVDDKALKTIIEDLYYPKSPYEFSVIPVEILGHSYEQYLGKVIKIDSKHKISIDEKPEVRKAGGVYYTPQYIVDYIVKNTVGKIIDGKTPDEITKIKIVDPACGSGSFLLGAYKYLLEWHLQYYKNAKLKNKAQYLTNDGRLTNDIKKKIIINNIFGVDIDTNAVEVTKLSLMLQVMEGETSVSIEHQSQLIQHRVLPSLDKNILSGNSLIDFDLDENKLDLEPEMKKKIKAFNWQNSFPEVFKQGGFDVVIGNPPWVDLKGHEPILVKYYFIKFYSTENRINLYSIFVEKSLELLNKNGLFSFIIPNSLLYQSSYTKIRQLILKNNNINEIVRLPDNTFEKVKAETIIINLAKEQNQNKTKCLLYDRNSIINVIDNNNPEKILYFNQDIWEKNNFSTFNIFSNEVIDILIKKIELNTIALENICDFTLGLTPYDKYKGHSEKTIKERKFHSTIKIDDSFKELLEGADVQRYHVCWGKKEYIKYGNWLGAPRKKEFFTNPRILIRQIVSGNPLRIYAGYTEDELYNTQTIFNLILKTNITLNLKVILGILNSKVINFYHTNKYLDVSKNLFQKILIQNCKMFPIPQNPEPKIQKQLIKLVDIMLQLNKDLQSTTLPEQKEQLQSRIKYTDKQIDQLVYQLYELTEDQIKIVEGE